MSQESERDLDEKAYISTPCVVPKLRKYRIILKWEKNIRINCFKRRMHPKARVATNVKERKRYILNMKKI